APAGTSARAPMPGSAAGSGDPGGFHPRLAHRRAGLPGHLHGRLAEVVSAALAGRLDIGALGGIEVARAPAATGIAVSINLAPVGGAAALRTLTSLGGRVANRSGNHVEAYLPAAALARLASIDGVGGA